MADATPQPIGSPVRGEPDSPVPTRFVVFVIGSLLPDGVAWAESFDDPEGAWLFPEEATVVAGAVDSRRKEFTTGRHCARTALSELGFAPQPIPRDGRGAPCWPTGVVGSITHCASYRAAAVASVERVNSIGIDAEPHDPLPADVLAMVARPAEIDHLSDLQRGQPGVNWDRTLFCAKEAVYKTWYPVTRRWLDFHDAEVTLDAGQGTFEARILVPGLEVAGRRIDSVAGRWHVAGSLVVTAITLPVIDATGRA